MKIIKIIVILLYFLPKSSFGQENYDLTREDLQAEIFNKIIRRIVVWRHGISGAIDDQNLHLILVHLRHFDKNLNKIENRDSLILFSAEAAKFLSMRKVNSALRGYKRYMKRIVYSVEKIEVLIPNSDTTDIAGIVSNIQRSTGDHAYVLDRLLKHLYAVPLDNQRRQVLIAQLKSGMNTIKSTKRESSQLKKAITKRRSELAGTVPGG